MRIQSLHDLHSSFPDIDGFWNFQNLDQTADRLRSLLPVEGQLASCSQIETMTQLARLYGLQGKLKEAKELLSASDELLKTSKIENFEDKSRAEIRCLLEDGRLHCLSRFPSRALESFNQAWLKSQRPDLRLFAIDAAYMISITAPLKQRKKWLQSAIEIAEASENPGVQLWLSHLYMMEGWQAFDTHDFEKAFNFFDKAGASCQPNEPKTRDRSRTLNWCKARALRALGDVQGSLRIQETILADLDQTGEANGHVYLEIAECYQTLDQPSKARSFYESAFEKLKLDKWYADNHDDELSRIQKNAKKAFR